MAIQLLPNGIGGVTGPVLVTQKPITIAGAIWYVGPGGSDANGGHARVAPKLTLAATYTAAAAGDLIVCLPGHAENIGASITFAKVGLTIVGEGLGNTRPAFTCSGAAINMFSATAVGTRFLNLRFPASTAVPTSRISLGAAGCLVEDCDFSVGSNDTGHTLTLSTAADHTTIRRTRFTLTAVGGGTGLDMTAAGALTNMRLEDLTFDGGSIGWSVSGGSALLFQQAATGFFATGLSFLNGAGMTFASTSTGIIAEGLLSGAPAVQWI